MRKVLKRTFGLLKSRSIGVAEDLGRAFDAVMDSGWQGKKGITKPEIRKDELKAKKVVVEVEKKKEAEKAPFLLHMQNGKVYNTERPLAEQDSDSDESEPEPLVASKKRRGGDMEMSVAKKARVELEEGEIEE
jgi:hypothetical protein